MLVTNIGRIGPRHGYKGKHAMSHVETSNTTMQYQCSCKWKSTEHSITEEYGEALILAAEHIKQNKGGWAGLQK
jgi:hypothetical protein